MNPALILPDGRRLPVAGDLVIGREDAGLVLADPAVERRHALVRPRDGALEVHDLGGPGGTWVRGRRLAAPALLGDGDELVVGSTVLRVDLYLPPPVATAALPELPPGRVASRMWVPAALTVLVILADAAALIAYFAAR